MRGEGVLSFLGHEICLAFNLAQELFHYHAIQCGWPQLHFNWVPSPPSVPKSTIFPFSIFGISSLKWIWKLNKATIPFYIYIFFKKPSDKLFKYLYRVNKYDLRFI